MIQYFLDDKSQLECNELKSQKTLDHCKVHTWQKFRPRIKEEINTPSDKKEAEFYKILNKKLARHWISRSE